MGNRNDLTGCTPNGIFSAALEYSVVIPAKNYEKKNTIPHS